MGVFTYFILHLILILDVIINFFWLIKTCLYEESGRIQTHWLLWYSLLLYIQIDIRDIFMILKQNRSSLSSL